jgi:hypothetical protein
MAQLTGEQLIDEVRALTGRGTDTVLCTTERINRWLNEAQEKIVRECPGLPCRHVEDVSAWTCVTTDNEYDLTDLGDGSWVPAHIETVWYRNGNQGYRLDFMPADEFDENYPDPTDTDAYSPHAPVAWTRKGQKVYVAPFPSSDYAAALAGDETGTYRVAYTAFAEDFTANDANTSDISMADDGLIFYAVAEAWGAIGSEEKRIIWKQKFRNWLDEYYAQYSKMSAWDNNVIMD